LLPAKGAAKAKAFAPPGRCGAVLFDVGVALQNTAWNAFGDDLYCIYISLEEATRTPSIVAVVFLAIALYIIQPALPTTTEEIVHTERPH